MRVRVCPCLERATFLRRLQEPIIAAAGDIDSTPLAPLVTGSAWITGTWSEIAAHAKRALYEDWAQKADTLTVGVTVVTDSDIVAAHFSDKYNNDDKRQVARLDLQTPRLVILRVGALSGKNGSAPGLLMDALLARRLRPLWLVDTPAAPFGPGLPSWSEAARDHLDTHFSRVEFGRAP